MKVNFPVEFNKENITLTTNPIFTKLKLRHKILQSTHLKVFIRF